jgi:hypothetical protein
MSGTNDPIHLAVDDGISRVLPGAQPPPGQRVQIAAPSLRFTQTGRELLRWLDARTVGPDGWETMLQGLPRHSAYVVGDLAYSCSQRWLELADALRERSTPEAH